MGECALAVADGDSHHADADEDTNRFIESGSRCQEQDESAPQEATEITRGQRQKPGASLCQCVPLPAAG